MKEIITYLNFDGNCRDAMKFYVGCSTSSSPKNRRTYAVR